MALYLHRKCFALVATELDPALEILVQKQILVLVGKTFFVFSGGGFFVRYHGLWTLRGIVSSGSSKADGGCDVDRYSLFTTVLDYTEWINDGIKKNFAWTNPLLQNQCKNC